MKPFFHTLLALVAVLPLQAQEYSDTYSPGKNKIYRKGWIDFNKNGVRDIYENPAARLEDRIEDLLKQMTLEEKTCQLVTLYGYHRVLKDELPTPRWKTRLWKDGVGAIDEHLNSFYSSTKPAYQSEYTWPASKHAWALNTVQKWFVEETRLGIPVDFTNEGIHGNESLRSTGFPTPLGLGATWDKELLNEVGRVTGREARMMGYTNTYGPILDVIRDQRWGRCEESFGESPYLVAELGIQFTRGLQENVLSTGKHFLAYSNNKGAREAEARCDPQMSPRELEYIHAYVWRRVVSEAGLMGAMVSYNDYDGLPMASSHYWMVERLRDEWGFRGYIVSDSEAVEYLHTKHRTASSQKEAAAQSILGGMNVRCTFREPDTFVLPLREAIAEGMVPMAVIDDRVRDVLRAKFLLGLFDDPYQRDLKGADEEVEKAENQEVSLRASRESAVLLKNRRAAAEARGPQAHCGGGAECDRHRIRTQPLRTERYRRGEPAGGHQSPGGRKSRGGLCSGLRPRGPELAGIRIVPYAAYPSGTGRDRRGGGPGTRKRRGRGRDGRLAPYLRRKPVPDLAGPAWPPA